MNHWIAVASAEHVNSGKELGIMQVCHGKEGPLKRLKESDWVTYYSPTLTFKGKDKCQQFTSIGRVKAGNSYQVEMEAGFCPFRRDVMWLDAQNASILPLLDELEFTKTESTGGIYFASVFLKSVNMTLHALPKPCTLIFSGE